MLPNYTNILKSKFAQIVIVQLLQNTKSFLHVCFRKAKIENRLKFRFDEHVSCSVFVLSLSF